MPWQTARKDPVYGTAEWKRARETCLRRAKWRCEIRLPGICTGVAREADHELGLANDPRHEHLRAACSPCHAQVSSRQGNAASRGGGDPDFTGPRTRW